MAKTFAHEQRREQNELTLMKVKMSVTVVNNSPIQHFVHVDDHTQPTDEMTPGFKPFTVLLKVL